jgi:predicted metal-dependent RNase
VSSSLRDSYDEPEILRCSSHSICPIGADVRQAAIEQLDNISAHADSAEILTWLSNFTSPPRRTYVVHGEPGATESLREEIEQTLGWEALVPVYLEEVELL